MIRVNLPRLLVLICILYFWAVGLSNLDRFPPVHEDEPWIAAPGYTFWEKGVFGTDLFAGFFGMEQHDYGFLPLFSIILGGGLHLFGMGLFQARISPLIFAMLTLALTYRLGAVLFSHWHGALAVGVLVGWRIVRQEAFRASGIPLADLARIARYDVAVPVFGLAALLLLTAALRKPGRFSFLAVGVLAALATETQFYGGFWIAALLSVLALHSGRTLKQISFTVLGFGLALLPWLLFVLSGWDDFLKQNRNNAGRFDLLNLQFYWTNLSNEIQDYQRILDAVNQAWGARLWLLLLLVGLTWLIVQAVWRRHQPSQIVLVVLGSMVVLFALVINRKTFSYLATLWPLFALVIAAGWVGLWRLSAKRRWKLLLILIFCGVIIEGGVSERRVQTMAAQTTPYSAFMDRIAAYLPPDSHVMGLQHYWFGLAERTRDYRSILVPINWTNPLYVENPISFGQAADAIPPDVMLLDQHILDLLAEAANPASWLYPLANGMQDYLRQRDARVIADFRDPTYGRFLIVQLNPSS